MKKKHYKCLLVNDTRYANHFGCETVIENITLFLLKLNIGILHTIPCGQTPKQLSELTFELGKVDFVIVNGEGSLHDDQKWALEIISFCEQIKSKFNLKVILLNALIHDNSKDFMKRLAVFDLINVRDIKSKKNVKAIDLKCILTSDFSLLLDIKKEELKKINNVNIIVTDSVDHLKTNNLFDFALKKNFNFIPINSLFDIKNFTKKEVVSKIKNQIKYFLSIILQHFGYYKSFNYIYYFLKTRQSLFNYINSSSGVFTGRFHMVCFCILFEKPFLAISSNTKKIEILCQEIGLDTKKRVVRNLENFDSIPKLESCDVEKIKSYINISKLRFDRLKEEIQDIIIKC